MRKSFLLSQIITYALSVAMAFSSSIGSSSEAAIRAPSFILGTGVSLEIVAHDWNTTKPLGFSPGHAFLCIATRLNSGIKEDCYGFYKVQSQGGRMSGPGVKRNEMSSPEAKPARFSKITVSIKRDITEQQRVAILKAADKWNDHHYDLTKENCIDFVAEAASIAGWTVPTRDATDTPESWVTKLRDANDLP